MLAGKADSLATVYPYAERQDVPASAEGSTGSAAGTHCGVLFSLGGVLHSIDQENSLCIHTGPGRCLGNSIYRNRLLRCASSELQCRSTADTETEASAAPNGAQPSLQRAGQRPGGTPGGGCQDLGSQGAGPEAVRGAAGSGDSRQACC